MVNGEVGEEFKQIKQLRKEENMAEKIKRWIRGFRISYPRSVFDMSPVNLDHFEETEEDHG